MFFKQIKHPAYPVGFHISDNRLFALAITGGAVRVLKKEGPGWGVIKEVPVTDENMKREWIAKILKSLEPLTTTKVADIENALPGSKEKEDPTINSKDEENDSTNEENNEEDTEEEDGQESEESTDTPAEESEEAGDEEVAQ